MKPDWNTICEHIGTATGVSFRAQRCTSQCGGCINSAWLVEDGERAFFIKTNTAARLPMFEAEAEGLRELAAADALRVPAPICAGLAGDTAFLALESIRFGRAGSTSLSRLGEALAALHRVTAPEYGWRRDNTLGPTPQPNGVTDDWVRFWRDRRLGYQLSLAAHNGHRGALLRDGERLLAGLDGILRSHRPAASLLHGDLWSGNYAVDDRGAPVIFDPAVYYGDREADLAMTELFGGFPPEFYAAYREAYPLQPGYALRKTLYNLYHVLNHLNLFGGGYLDQAHSMIQRLLAETRG